MKIVTLVLVMAVVVTVTESRPFFGIFPFRSIVCEIMCQPPYLDSFCAFCDRSAPGRNTAQSSASASSNGNANVQANSSASVQRGNGTPVRRTTTTTSTTGASSPPGGAAPATPTTTPATETTTQPGK